MKLDASNPIQHFLHIFTEIPFNRILGLKLDKIEQDHIILSFAMKEELIGNYMHGILHGGVISSVLDMAGGAAAMISTIQKKSTDNLEKLAAMLSKTGTINLHVDFLRPGKGTQFRIKAWTLHSGNKITFARMEMFNQDGVLISNGSASYLIG